MNYYINSNNIQVPYLKTYLRRRWDKEDQRIADILKAIERNEDWTRFLIKDVSHKYKPLPLTGSLTPTGKFAGPKDLRGINISGLNFSNSESLSETYFDYSKIHNTVFVDSHLYGTSFQHCHIESSDYSGSHLHQSKFNNSKMYDINFCHAILSFVSLRDTYINKCQFLNAETNEVNLTNEPAYWHFLSFSKTNRGTKIINLEQNLSEMDSGKLDRDFLHFLKGQKQINNYRKNIPVLSWFFYVLSDYGRSFKRLALNFVFLLVAFGFVYSGFYPLNDIITNEKARSVLIYLTPSIQINNKNISSDEIILSYYFSFKSLTNLGTANLKAVDRKGELYYITERFAGYLILGVFITMVTSRFIKSWR